MRFLPNPEKISRTDASVANGLAHGFELAGVVIVFFFIGFGLDAWLDTKPIFMVVLTLLGVFGLLARAWYDFSTKMDEIEAARQMPRTTSPSTVTSSTSATSVTVDEHA